MDIVLYYAPNICALTEANAPFEARALNFISARASIRRTT